MERLDVMLNTVKQENWATFISATWNKVSKCSPSKPPSKFLLVRPHPLLPDSNELWPLSGCIVGREEEEGLDV